MTEEGIALTEAGGGSRKTGGDGPLSRSTEQNQGDLRGDDASREEILDSFLQEYRRVKNTSFVGRLADPSGVRANMVMPLEQLPDLFLAVPVLYSYQEVDQRKLPFSPPAQELYGWSTTRREREFNSQQHFLLQLFGNQLWCDLYQIFNRKWRSMARYQGDTIPSSLHIRMDKARDVFDDIVICTPYHHEALKDLEEIATWRPERRPEPYALGLIRDKGTYPFAVVLGRFIEDGGLFPDYFAMVEHTMSFLRRIAGDLEKLNATDPNMWYHTEAQSLPLGTRLTKQVELLLNLHESNILTDVLRQNPQLT